MAGTDISKVTRECRGCTMCCEGWLSADIKGHLMYPGQKCFYLKPVTCCSIYDTNNEKYVCVLNKKHVCLWNEEESNLEDVKKQSVILNLIFRACIPIRKIIDSLYFTVFYSYTFNSFFPWKAFHCGF